MSKRILPVAAACAAVLAGCAVEPPDGAKPLCGTVHVTVTHAPGYLAMHPEHVYVCETETIIIQTAPRVEREEAEVAAVGDRQPTWLSGKSNERGLIEIHVPDVEDEEYGLYKYSFTVKGIGTLDPRVTVTRH